MAYLRKLSVNNITSYIVKRNKISLDVIFYILLISSFLVRAINLNYNSPFNDEAIYIVVGTFLVEEIYQLTRLIALSDSKTNQTAAITAAFLARFSGIGIFVSKL